MLKNFKHSILKSKSPSNTHHGLTISVIPAPNSDSATTCMMPGEQRSHKSDTMIPSTTCRRLQRPPLREVEMHVSDLVVHCFDCYWNVACSLRSETKKYIEQSVRKYIAILLLHQHHFHLMARPSFLQNHTVARRRGEDYSNRQTRQMNKVIP